VNTLRHQLIQKSSIRLGEQDRGSAFAQVTLGKLPRRDDRFEGSLPSI
jgi:hypothetical protein